MTCFGRMARWLKRDTRGTAMLEFALAMPLVLTLGLYGAETANRAIVQMRINQIAVLVADNTSRVGENSLLGEVKLYEADINDIFLGAGIQAGSLLDLYRRGRVIISSQEVVPGSDNDQYIHWQRCMGELRYASTYGDAGDGLTGGFPGMGDPGEEIYVFPGEAAIFIEIAYSYDPLITDLFDEGEPIVAVASFHVRNNRDLSQVFQRPSATEPIADCDKFASISAAT